MRRELAGLVMIWFAALTLRVLEQAALSPDDLQVSRSNLHILSFALVGGVLVSLALTMLFVCHTLAIMVDNFCIHVNEIRTRGGNLTKAVEEWNVLQAVLRKASRSIEYCFFALQTTAFFSVLLAFIDVAQGSEFLVVPGGLLLLGLTRIFYSAAAITDKCAHVPSLINSLHFGEDVDFQRQYVVQYIIQSDAGFRVLGVPMNSAVTLKLAYFCVIAAFGLMHRVLSSAW